MDGEAGEIRLRRGRDVAMALVAALLFSYVVARAVRVPIVHDEAFGYLNFVGRSFSAILSTNVPGPANNHLLNSLLSRLTALAFGPHEWALRLPSVLSFGLYLGCGAALCRRFSSTPAAACGFVLFAANPFALELFSLSRGYGLGLAFLSLALLLFVRAEEKPAFARRELIAGGLSAFLAVLANLTFILPVLALVVVSAALNRRELRSRAPSLAVAPLLVAALLGPWVVTLQRAGQFYAGGSKGFLADTVGSLVQVTAASGAGTVATAATGVVAAILLALGLLGALVPAGAAGQGIARLATPVLVLAAGASVAQHALFGTPHLRDRTAVFFLPLLALGAGAGLDVLTAASRPSLRIGGRSLAVGLTALAALPLIRSANLDRTTIWRYDADARRVVSELSALHTEGLGHIRLGGTWFFEPALNFYRETRHLAWLEPIVRYDPLDRCNVVLSSWDEPVVLRSGEFVGRRGYPLSRSTLLVRVRPAGSGSVREDSGLTGSLDAPEGGETVSGDLRIGGWARIPGEDLRVTVLIDGVPREDALRARVPRPDVAAVLPTLGDCSRSGFEGAIPFRPGDGGPHMIEAVFASADGRERHYCVRGFTWRK